MTDSTKVHNDGPVEDLQQEDNPERECGSVPDAQATAEPSEEVEESPDTVIEKLQEEKRELNDRLLRTSADFENFRKRSRQQQEELGRVANERLIADLLPVIDDFERALDSPEESADLNSWKAGVQLIARRLAEVLGRYGVQVVESMNAQFDPTRHEAIGQVVTEEYPEGCVIEELQKGYMLHERLLRPARVRVASSPLGGTAIEDSEAEEEAHA